MLNNQPVLQRLNWSQARDRVRQVNPVLAAIIDELDPDPSYALFELTAPFGTEILREGVLQLPNEEGEMLPISDSQLDSRITRELDYVHGGTPLALMLENNGEIFLPVKNRNAILIGDIITPGKLFFDQRLLGHSVAYHPELSWHMTIGARSLFMLPKITSETNYRRIKNHLGIHLNAPASLKEHWHIFCTLANQIAFGEPWCGQVMFFGRRWLEHLNDKAWARFNYYLYKNGWDTTAFGRDKLAWDVTLSSIKQQANLRPDPYVADTVKYVLMISLGGAPGFAPAVDNSSAPISRLQRIFSDVYQLGLYEPIIMQPSFLDWQDPGSSVYYSLNYPTTTEFSPRSRKLTNKIADIAEMQRLITQYVASLAGDKLQLSALPLEELQNRIGFEYFHSDNERSAGVLSTSQIPVLDRRFVVRDSDALFPSESPFINGCVRMKVK
jgi:hypothetical protein